MTTRKTTTTKEYDEAGRLLRETTVVEEQTEPASSWPYVYSPNGWIYQGTYTINTGGADPSAVATAIAEELQKR